MLIYATKKVQKKRDTVSQGWIVMMHLPPWMRNMIASYRIHAINCQTYLQITLGATQTQQMNAKCTLSLWSVFVLVYEGK